MTDTSKMTHSFSSVETFEHCKYAYKLTYIDKVERKNNFWGAYGTYVHKIIELFFKDKLEFYDLSSYFEKNFKKNITIYPPGFIKMDSYYAGGLEFFNKFNFNKNKCEIMYIEEKFETVYKGEKIVVKPDLVLKRKTDNKTILIDYKTGSRYKNKKIDKDKHASHLHQMYLYSYFLWDIKNIAIDEIHIWHVKEGEIEKIMFDPNLAQETIEWFWGIIEKIKNEEFFEYNNKSSFWCNSICSVKDDCEYRPLT
jgi:hypothetical protein